MRNLLVITISIFFCSTILYGAQSSQGFMAQDMQQKAETLFTIIDQDLHVAAARGILGQTPDILFNYKIKRNGQDALMLTALKKRFDLLELIDAIIKSEIEERRDTSKVIIFLNQQDSDGNTALHHALKISDNALFIEAFLSRFGAFINTELQDKEGKTVKTILEEKYRDNNDLKEHMKRIQQNCAASSSSSQAPTSQSVVRKIMAQHCTASTKPQSSSFPHTPSPSKPQKQSASSLRMIGHTLWKITQAGVPAIAVLIWLQRRNPALFESMPRVASILNKIDQGAMVAYASARSGWKEHVAPLIAPWLTKAGSIIKPHYERLVGNYTSSASSALTKK